jgi:predicted RNase H-like HicB family nuclease
MRPESHSEVEDRTETVRVIYHHEADGWWAESPDVEGWSAAGSSYAEVVKLAEEGISFAREQDAALEHFVPASEHAAA